MSNLDGSLELGDGGSRQETAGDGGSVLLRVYGASTHGQETRTEQHDVVVQ